MRNSTLDMKHFPDNMQPRCVALWATRISPGSGYARGCASTETGSAGSTHDRGHVRECEGARSSLCDNGVGCTRQRASSLMCGFHCQQPTPSLIGYPPARPIQGTPKELAALHCNPQFTGSQPYKWRSSYQMLSQHPGCSPGNLCNWGPPLFSPRAISMNPTGSKLKGGRYVLAGNSRMIDLSLHRRRGGTVAGLAAQGCSPGRTANLYVLDRSAGVPIILEESNG
jgi:hypothetical protein